MAATRPSLYIDWTDGNASKVQQPSSPKQLLGWVYQEAPPFRFMNWLFYILDQWVQWFDQENLSPGYTVVTHGMSPYAVAATDRRIYVDDSGGNVQINLPAIASADGRELRFKRISTGGNTTTISGDANQDGQASQQLTAQFEGYGTQAAEGAWYNF